MKDPNILLSMVNCKLRDCCKSLEDICDDLDLSSIELREILKSIDYYYNPQLRQFVYEKNGSK